MISWRRMTSQPFFTNVPLEEIIQILAKKPSMGTGLTTLTTLASVRGGPNRAAYNRN